MLFGTLGIFFLRELISLVPSALTSTNETSALYVQGATATWHLSACVDLALVARIAQVVLHYAADRKASRWLYTLRAPRSPTRNPRHDPAPDFCARACTCGLLGAGSREHGQALRSRVPGARHVAPTEASAAARGICTICFGAVCRTTHVTGLVTDLGLREPGKGGSIEVLEDREVATQSRNRCRNVVRRRGTLRGAHRVYNFQNLGALEQRVCMYGTLALLKIVCQHNLCVSTSVAALDIE